MHLFKIGEKVKIIDQNIYAVLKRPLDHILIGRIVIITSTIGVMFDCYNSDLHSLYGSCPDGYGWWFIPDELVKIETLKKITVIKPLF